MEVSELYDLSCVYTVCIRFGVVKDSKFITDRMGSQRVLNVCII